MTTFLYSRIVDTASSATDRGLIWIAERNDSGTNQQASANSNYGTVSINASGWLWVTGNLNAGVTGNLVIMGVSAHDAAGSTTVNPLAAGAYATGFSTTTADVAAGDITRMLATRGGSTFVLGGSPAVHSREWEVSGVNTNIVLASGAASLKYVVTEAGCHVGGSCTVNVSVRMGFATGNLPATGSATAGAEGILLAVSACIPGGGVVRGGGMGVLGVGADNEGIVLTTTVPTGGRVKVWATYFVTTS